MHVLQELLEEKNTLLIDGAMGTELFKRGLANGDPPETWNTELPDRVLDVHRQYIRAGSHIILTNSFGGTSFRLKLHNLQAQAYAFNKAAAEIARQAADTADRKVVVAGSIGPTGEILQPMGQMAYADGVAAFAEQARGLHAGGVDVFWIETMSDLKEVQAAVEGIRSVSDRPICATMTFDTKGYTMMGVTPQDAVRTLTDWGLFAIGANCGNGPDEIEAVVDLMHQVLPEAILIAKSNAGLPAFVAGELIYDGTPQVMAEYAQRVRALGARIIGGCCGNNAEHVAAMAAALEEVPSGELVVEARGFMVDDKAKTGRDSASSGRRRRRRRS